MEVTVLISAHGDERWRDLAYSRAYPSAAEQAPTLVHYERGATLAQVRNAAAKRATTEWLCFLDADDELDYGYMDAMRRAVEGEALLAPAVKYLHPGRVTAPAALPNESGDMRSVNRCVIGTLIRAETFWAQGGFQEWPCYEDWDLFLGAYLAGAPLVYVPDAVYKAHVSRGSRNVPTRTLAVATYRAIQRKHGLIPA